MNNKYIIGIDPGTKGAIAILDSTLNEIIDVRDLPTRKQGKGGAASSQMVCPLQLAEHLHPYAVPGTMAFIEAAIVKPPMKLVSARTVGLNYGVVLAVMATLGIGYREFAPSDWKKQLGLSDDKNDSVALATSLYPRDVAKFKRHDLAEALLIPRAALRGGAFI